MVRFERDCTKMNDLKHFPKHTFKSLTIHSLMDVDHDDAFKLIEDVPNCLIWTRIARNFFGLFPNTEWNSLHRAL